MVIIGITGTKGKTTAANFVWSCLNAADMPCGLITTANIKIGDHETLNNYHMTMPGRFELQRLMNKMLEAKCKYCVIETTSEGIKQFRHIGINYDIVVFTNIYREHLQSHGGSFERYKEAKSQIFAGLKNSRKKTIDSKPVEKIIFANNDSPYKNFFLGFDADKKVTFGLSGEADFYAFNPKDEERGVSFFVNDYQKYHINVDGKFNVPNALIAIAICKTLGVSTSNIQKGLEAIEIIPGRMERIDGGQNFIVYVDYAHQKESMESLLESAKDIAATTKGKIIVLLGAEGGGRDKEKRPAMGEAAAKMADFIIVSNVDPYDDNPAEIINDIVVAAKEHGKEEGKNLFAIQDRRSGIRKAVSLARKNDVVLITGKGSEQSMIIGNKTIPWDDRTITREELAKLKNKD
jgi:UDP-N-acetylmuramoyl-L-alanyl-D-glutamate--2,6-diaminopimelate ligase